jgi:ribosomal protein L16/L10AE
MIFDILGCVHRWRGGRQIVCIGQCSLSQRASAARKTAGGKTALSAGTPWQSLNRHRHALKRASMKLPATRKEATKSQIWTIVP